MNKKELDILKDKIVKEEEIGRLHDGTPETVITIEKLFKILDES